MTAAVDPRRRGEQRRLRQRVNTNKTQPGRQRNWFPPCGTTSNKKMADLLQKSTSGTRRIDTETSSDPVRPDKAGRDRHRQTPTREKTCGKELGNNERADQVGTNETAQASSQLHIRHETSPMARRRHRTHHRTRRAVTATRK
jgi:hypothetical protein